LSHGGFSIASCGEDESGEIYVADYGNGTIAQLMEPTCSGDCNDDGPVTLDEVLTVVNIALGNQDVSACRLGDPDGDQRISVDEILAAVNNLLKLLELTWDPSTVLSLSPPGLVPLGCWRDTRSAPGKARI